MCVHPHVIATTQTIQSSHKSTIYVINSIKVVESHVLFKFDIQVTHVSSTFFYYPTMRSRSYAPHLYQLDTYNETTHMWSIYQTTHLHGI